jgi:hypothetical protein
LASLLWRLRRATAIETDLLRIQAEILRDRRLDRFTKQKSDPPLAILDFPASMQDGKETTSHSVSQADDNYYCHAPHQTSQPVTSPRQLTLCFQRLANLDNGVFDRLGRYESAIARQVLRTLYLLQSVRTR